MANLTKQQELFCRLYEENGHNGTAAAIAAGYSQKTATVAASKLLKNPKIAKYRADLVREMYHAIGLSPEQIALRKEKVYEESVKRGQPNLSLKALESMEKSMRTLAEDTTIDIKIKVLDDGD